MEGFRRLEFGHGGFPRPLRGFELAVGFRGLVGCTQDAASCTLFDIPARMNDTGILEAVAALTVHPSRVACLYGENP